MTRSHLLRPSLPFAMHPRIDAALNDPQRLAFVDATTRLKYHLRAEAFARDFGDRYDRLRHHAGAIKQHVLDHLDHYLGQYIDAAEAAGVQVHLASDAERANAIALAIAEDAGARTCVKSKSMVTEEIGLLAAFEHAGIETLETDLGEFILQLDGDAPAHIVTPMIHKDRRAVARAFVRELGAEYTEDPEQLTRIAREYMRERYQRADIGVTGANFLIAADGALVIATNEGNADFVVSGPRVHIAVVGIEKLVPTTRHVAVFLKLLARSATAQDLTVYTSFVHGPRRPSTERDGPDAVHVILLDNGRSRLLAEETRELLRCIRCGACLNACPVFRRVGGGHAYGAVYSGPIGAALTPHLVGVDDYADLPRASSLCGACREVCPVAIDLPAQLIALRRSTHAKATPSVIDRLAFRVWAHALASRRRFEFAQRCLRFVTRFIATPTAPGSLRYLSSGPPFGDAARDALTKLTATRDLPLPNGPTFRDWWRERRI